MRKRTTSLILLLCLVFLPGCASHHSHHHGGEMMKAEGCEKMHGEKKRMMEEMKAKDAELQDAVSRMQAAKGQQKVDMLADIVKRMVEQRAAMHTKMEEMKGHPGMRYHDGCKCGDDECPMKKK